jgi:hypothetical protein
MVSYDKSVLDVSRINMKITALILILCLFVQSCSLGIEGFKRAPASAANIDSVITRLKEFKIVLVGQTLESSCTPEQIEKDFNALMKSVKRNSCSVDNFTFDKEAFTEKKCPKAKKDGYLDRIVKKTIQEEKDEKENLSVFQEKLDPEFIKHTQTAISFLKEVSSYLHNESIESSLRAKLLIEYSDAVLLPIRDIVIAKRSYLPKEDDGKVFYNSLQPYLTDRFVSQLKEEELNQITQGLEPALNPFYLNIEAANSNTKRLVFSEKEIIKRDILTLLKAPTAKNYVMALKWMTLHMMLTQVFMYDNILENNSELPIPKSCQNHFNGNLPSSFKFKYEDKASEEFIHGLLIGHGLAFNEEDPTFLNYYLENVNADPTKEGYNGMVPFENYKNALVSFEERREPLSVKPQLDDQAHFEEIMKVRKPEVMSVFKGKLKDNLVNYAGLEIFEKILKAVEPNETAEVKLANGTIETIVGSRMNLSTYLQETMAKNGVTEYTKLITPNIEKKFAGKTVDLEFPSLYSSPIWRSWSLRYLADTIDKVKDSPEQSTIYQSVRNACAMSTRRTMEVTDLCFKGNALQNLNNYLAEFRSGDRYIPTSRLETPKYKDIYPLLSHLWIVFRDQHKLLPEAKPSELGFLLDQMASGNPWARIKLGYLVVLDQLDHQQKGLIPQYNTKNYFAKENEEVMCKINNSSVQYNNIARAGKLLGLDKPLNNVFAEKILESEEKKIVWRELYDNINQRSGQIFTVKAHGLNYYKLTENISYKTILSEQAALNTGVKLSQRAINDIKKVSASIEVKLGQFFLDLYKEKDVEKQQKMFESFTNVNGVDANYASKAAFLIIDHGYKKPIYRDLIKQAALSRKLQVVSELDRFCNMNVNDQNQLKTLFYQASKAQNQINQMAGLPGVPKKAMEKINEMTPGEWRDLWLGIGSGVVGIAAAITAGSCTILTGGLCGGVVLAAGLGAAGLQATVASNEFARHKEADFNVAQVKLMEDLGFAKSGSYEEVSRSYAWAAVEVISIFPLLGIASRSAALGPKLIYASSQELMKKTGKTSFKAITKSAGLEEEVRGARNTLGFFSIASNAGLDSKTINNALDKIDRIKVLYKKNEIDLNTMIKRIYQVVNPIKRAKYAIAKTKKGEIGTVVVRESKEQIDLQTAKVVADYFSGNPKEMQRLMSSYSGEKLNNSLRIMGELNAVDKIDGIPIYSGVRDWWLRIRNESLAKNAAKIVRIERELASVGGNPGELEKYIAKNIEDLTDIFYEIPFRKREIPYFVFVQGMPEFNFYKGRKIPLLSEMSQGQTLRRLFMARSRLVHESIKAKQRFHLKLPRHAQSETTFKLFTAFKQSIVELASRKSVPEAKKILGQYRSLEEQMARKLHAKYKAGGDKLEFKKFKNLIFNPANREEKATAEAIWESVPAAELMKMKELEDFAHKVVQGLSKYDNVDSFDKYVNALKILMVNKNVAVLEII